MALGFMVSACVSNNAPYNTREEPVVAATSLDRVWSNVPATMDQHDLKGLSVAVFDNYEVVGVRAFGLKSVDAQDQITPTTAFSTASISKPVTALLCLILDEEGVIDIDAPIANYLKSWRLPESDFSAASQVTWRQLLTHTAGTSQHGFADYYEGDALPILIDSLEGRIPRYDTPIEFLFEPGTDWKYSGGGYTIVQLALEDHIGRSLADLAQQKVFGPLGMQHTTMIQPGAIGFPSDVASVHDENGMVIRTGLPITPQISASGMWSTPSDLAIFGIAIQKALNGNTEEPINPAIAREMTDMISLEYVGGMGMPFFRGFGFGNTEWFRHDGSNTGVNSDLMGSMEGGYGFVIMGNGDDANTDAVFAMLRAHIIQEMNWDKRSPQPTVPLDASLNNNILGSYTGLLYNLGLEYRIEEESGRLWIASEFFTQFLGRDRSEMQYLGNNEFAIADYPNRLRFNHDTDGTLRDVTIYRPGSSVPIVTRKIGDMR